MENNTLPSSFLPTEILPDYSTTYDVNATQYGAGDVGGARNIHPAIRELLALGYEKGDRVTGRNIPITGKNKDWAGTLTKDWAGTLTEDNIQLQEYSWKSGKIKLDGEHHEDGLAWLHKENQLGKQIYFNVNAGRENKEVSRIFSVFFEHDSGTHAEQMAKVLNFSIPASVAVRTRKSTHTYYTVYGDDIEDIEGWVKLQEKIAYTMGSDPAVKDRPRLMRLAGFDHIKDGYENVLCTLEICDGDNSYTFGEIEQAIADYAVKIGVKPFTEARFKAYQFVTSKLNKKKDGRDYSHPRFSPDFFRTCEDSEFAEQLQRCKDWARLYEKRFKGIEDVDPESAWTDELKTVKARVKKEYDIDLVPNLSQGGELLTVKWAKAYTEGFEENGRSGWHTCKCPAHGGNSYDSLHINAVTGALKCHSGCESRDVEVTLRQLAKDAGDPLWNVSLYSSSSNAPDVAIAGETEEERQAREAKGEEERATARKEMALDNRKKIAGLNFVGEGSLIEAASKFEKEIGDQLFDTNKCPWHDHRNGVSPWVQKFGDSYLYHCPICTKNKGISAVKYQYFLENGLNAELKVADWTEFVENLIGYVEPDEVYNKRVQEWRRGIVEAEQLELNSLSPRDGDTVIDCPDGFTEEERKKILQELPSPLRGIFALVGPTGSGKTELTKEILEKYREDTEREQTIRSILSFSPTILLSHSSSARLGLYTREEAEGDYKARPSVTEELSICYPSLYKLGSPQKEGRSPINRRGYSENSVLILDEVRQGDDMVLLSRLCDKDDQRPANISEWMRAHDKSDVQILSDAYLTNLEVDLRRKLRPDLPVIFIRVPVKPIDRKVYRMPNKDTFFTALDEKLMSGERIDIATDNQKKGEELDLLYSGKEDNNGNKIVVLRVDANTKDLPEQQDFIDNPNTYLRENKQVRLVIWSPSLGSGFGFWEGNFDSQFAFDSHLISTDFCQLYRRDRQNQPLHCFVTADKGHDYGPVLVSEQATERKHNFARYAEMVEVARAENPTVSNDLLNEEIGRMIKNESDNILIDHIDKMRARKAWLSENRAEHFYKQLEKDGITVLDYQDLADSKEVSEHLKELGEVIDLKKATAVVRADVVDEATGKKLLEKDNKSEKEKAEASRYIFESKYPGFLTTLIKPLADKLDGETAQALLAKDERTKNEQAEVDRYMFESNYPDFHAIKSIDKATADALLVIAEDERTDGEQAELDRYIFERKYPGLLDILAKPVGERVDDREAIDFYLKYQIKDSGKWLDTVQTRFAYENRVEEEAKDFKKTKRKVEKMRLYNTAITTDFNFANTPLFKFVDEIGLFEFFNKPGEQQLTLPAVAAWIYKLDNSKDGDTEDIKAINKEACSTRLAELMGYVENKENLTTRQVARKLKKNFVDPLPAKYVSDLKELFGFEIPTTGGSLKLITREVNSKILNKFGYHLKTTDRKRNGKSLYLFDTSDADEQEVYRLRLEVILYEKLEAERQKKEQKEKGLEIGREKRSTPCSENVSAVADAPGSIYTIETHICNAQEVDHHSIPAVPVADFGGLSKTPVLETKKQASESKESNEESKESLAKIPLDREGRWLAFTLKALERMYPGDKLAIAKELQKLQDAGRRRKALARIAVIKARFQPKINLDFNLAVGF